MFPVFIIMIIAIFKFDLPELLWHVLISILLYQGHKGGECRCVQRACACISAPARFLTGHIQGQESLDSAIVYQAYNCAYL